MHGLRRRFLLGACGACLTSMAGARVLRTDLASLLPGGYEPLDADERGMWQICDQVEEMIRTSPQRLDAPALHDYTRGVVERLVGRETPDLRVYLMRDSGFNASMYPTGMMIVNTGLMARVRNEAQYAAVLGHEAGHFFRKHAIAGYRSTRRKSSAAAFAGAAAYAAAGYSHRYGYSGAQSWIDSANAINQALYLSMFQFSRDKESEADAYGIMLMSRSGYSPNAASQIWGQLISERKASAAQRNAKYKDRSGSSFSTHPPTEDRMEDLAETAEHLAASDAADRRSEWLTAIEPFRAMLLDEQVRLNDPGASLYLVESLAQDGWTGLLRYNEGEVYRLRGAEGDEANAAEAYAAATALPDAPAEAWRAHGFALIKAGKNPEGREALTRYLALKPDAKDAGIVRFTLAQ
jgi:beta-barrel assembly-enhancing protease